MPDYITLYQQGKKYLEEYQILEADISARELLLYTCNISIQDFWIKPYTLILPEEEEQYWKYIRKRAKHCPLQYITNIQNFYGLDFYVDKAVLIPRQDTECLVELILKKEKDIKTRCLDICTGSGCIAITLAKRGKYQTVVAGDISGKALDIARKNAKIHQVNILFMQSDMFRMLHDKKRQLDGGLELKEGISQNKELESLDIPIQYDYIVSNPPYIKTDIILDLSIEVRDYEPILALDGNVDGLAFYRILVEQGRDFLKPNGRLYLEIGYDQGKEVSALLENAGYQEIQVYPDLAGKDRIIRAVYSKQK